MTTTFQHRNLPGLLLRAREALMTQHRPALRAQGLSDPQWRVLRVLDRCGDVQEGLETGVLAREAQLLGPSLSGVLQRMERDGLVQRQRAMADARRSVVRATPRGQALLQALSPSIEAQYDRLAQGLGAQRLTQLYALLDALIALQDVSSPAPGEAPCVAQAYAPAAPALNPIEDDPA